MPDAFLGLIVAIGVSLLIGAFARKIVGDQDWPLLGWPGRRAPLRWQIVTAVVAAVLCGGYLLSRGPVAEAAIDPQPMLTLRMAAQMTAVAVLAGATPALAYFDVRLHRLPDRIVLPMTGLVLLLAGVGALTGAGFALPAPELLRPFLAAILLAGLFAVIYLIPRSGLGLGDVKLMLPIGIITGFSSWLTVIGAVYAGVLFAGLAAAALLVTKRRRGTDPIAYGPFLLLGAWTAVIGSLWLSVGS
ncbi:A24 family peptidase [Saxibacter everestensis]|uniref:A24 family peptidase n=1 Tax=Saxibacter everestensis TaxID=2909229 RepID=A0ABY8QXQ1_9MICO|nr:A24 family peptidase [Brevibacteriaceae bacterium ZFBP1038]